MYCMKCGKKVSFYYEEVGLDENKKMLYNKFEKCKNCNTVKQVPLDYGVPQYKPRETKKETALSLIASAFCLFALVIPLPVIILFLLNLTSIILAIIDVCINDKTKGHGGSWVSIIICVIVVFAGFAFGWWGLTGIGVGFSKYM